MVNRLKKLLEELRSNPNVGGRAVQKKVKYSVEKYRKAYELLEKYDQSSSKNPEILAKPERLRRYIQGFSKNTGVRRTDPVV